MINAIDYGFVPDVDTFDNASKWASFLTETDNQIYFPSGYYYFLSHPNTTNKNIFVQGNSFSNTALVRHYQTQSAYETFIEIRKGKGCRFENITIGSDMSTDGIAFALWSELNGDSPDFFTCRNLNITSYNGSTWKRGAWLFGGQRIDPQYAIGLRDCHFDNLSVFNCTENTIDINLCRSLYMTCQVYQGSGSTSLIQIGGSATNKTNSLVLTAQSYIGSINVWHCEGAIITAPSIANINEISSTLIKYVKGN